MGLTIFRAGNNGPYPNHLVLSGYGDKSAILGKLHRPDCLCLGRPSGKHPRLAIAIIVRRWPIGICTSFVATSQFLRNEYPVEIFAFLVMRLYFDVLGRRRKARNKSDRLGEDFCVHASRSRFTQLRSIIVGTGNRISPLITDDAAQERDPVPTS